jgi:hypothetical protein
MSSQSASAPPRAANDTNQAPANPPAPQEQLMQMLCGAWVARSISAAATLRIADHVGESARGIDEIAAASGTHPASLYRLMRALSSVGVFAEEGPRRFRHTPLSALLRTGAPGSLRACADSIFGRCHYRSWGQLEHSLRTGDIAFDHAHGMGVWDFFAKTPDEQQSFDAAMSEFTVLFNPPVVKGYDFSKFKTLVDVGGGHGALLAAIARSNPKLRGTVYDQPHVVPGARRRFEQEGLSDRLGAEGGNFFESVPPGADAYLMKLIIHDWDEPRATQILLNIHRAAKPGARLLVVDSVVPEGPGPDFSKFGDVNMLVMTGGKERTAAEFRELLDAAGFELLKVHPTEGPLSIVEGVRR